MTSAEEKARNFCENEREFHLGAMPTEQSNPKTRTLAETTLADTAAGIRMMQTVDMDILPRAREVFASAEFNGLVKAVCTALQGDGRIIFVGCGATGRLSILLEAIWRRFWQALKSDKGEISNRVADLEDRVLSVMTAGDHALIRSVENFEDFAQFGQQQLIEAGARKGDVVVAITEGGETSFVIGAAWKGLEIGASVFFVCNNPSDILAQYVKRSREIIEEPRITNLDISSGPMAVAGSTRMQATTSELLVVGGALELGLRTMLAGILDEADLVKLGFSVTNGPGYAQTFEKLLLDLAKPAAVDAIAGMTEFEQKLYAQEGLLTYMADDFLLDILTDTTERAPTFRLPPFRKCDDHKSARSWAFVKNPTLSTPETWLRTMRRPLRGLTWDDAMYQRLNAPEKIQKSHPKLDKAEIMKFQIGFEDDPSRYEAPASAAVLVLVGDEVNQLLQPEHAFRRAFEKTAANFDQRAAFCIGPEGMPPVDLDKTFLVPCNLAPSPFSLWDRLAIKLVLNTVSTATMARMGRLMGNLMVCVEVSNKKLIDRGTRLIAEVTGLDYEHACCELFKTLEKIDSYAKPGQQTPSPVAITIQNLLAGKAGAATGVFDGNARSLMPDRQKAGGQGIS